MTTYAEWIFSRLTGVTAAGDRVYPGGKLPEGVTLPAISYFRVSGPRDHTQSSGDVPYPRFQITCWGKDHDEADALGDQVVQQIGGVRATVGLLKSVALIDDDRGPLPDPETDEFMRTIDIVIW